MKKSRTVQETFLGNKFVPATKDSKGRFERGVDEVAIDQKVMPIYKIEGHNVNLKELEAGRLVGLANNVVFNVEYRLGESGRESFTANFIDATQDYRTLVFTHPTLPNMTIGIPIMNIYSCTRVRNK